MRNEARLIQVFLSKTSTSGLGIYEVSVDEDGDLFCTCSKFDERSACKHTKFVLTRIESNNGHYPLEILSKATEEEASVARKSKEAYRRFIIKYGKIEVY